MMLPGERLDDLEYNGLRILQKADGYCFTSDSVLLANLCNVKKGDKVCDLCTGSGIVAILVTEKFSPSLTIGVELQNRLADMAERSVLYNKLDDRINIVCAPVQGVEEKIGKGIFDVVVCNPPYAYAEKKENYTEEEICKTEASLTLEEVVQTASKLLKFGGNFYMVHKSYRLTDALCLMRKYIIEPKKLWLIQPKASKDVDTFIVEGKRNGKPNLLVPTPIVVYNEDGTYTETARRIYGK